MPYYSEEILSNSPYQFGFADDYDEEFGDAKSDAAKRRASAQRAAAAKKAAAQRAAAQRAAAAKKAAAQRAAAQRAATAKKAAANKKPTRLKTVKTKNPYSLTPDDLALSQTIFRVENGRGAEVGGGIPAPYNPFSINNPPPPPPRISVVTTNAKPSKVDSIFGIASQIIAGWSPNKTVQTADGQAPIYNVPNYQQPNVASSDYPTNLSNDGGAGAGVGKGLGEGFDGIISWATANPLIVVGVGVGAFLLFKQPPGRRG
jgi:hypothetical protein